MHTRFLALVLSAVLLLPALAGCSKKTGAEKDLAYPIDGEPVCLDPHDQYCDDECHIKANKFYEKGERFGKLFAVINMICVFGIPIGLFMLSFAREVGLTVALASCVILGIMLIILPFPTENMISKFKIQKAVKITRIIGGAVIFLGVLILLLALLIKF